MTLEKSEPLKEGASAIKIIPVRSEKKLGRFGLARYVIHCLQQNKVRLRNRDIVVVSSKFASMAEGRMVRLENLQKTREGAKLSRKYAIERSLAELVARESESIIGGIPGFALAVSKGILAPNAGIDRSNVPHGYAILYPKNPFESARALRLALIKKMQKDLGGPDPERNTSLGVILSDSRISPGRLGTTGLAISASGFEPLIDFRGKPDLFGNKLKVTVRAIADQIASAAQLVMGEADEATPIAVIRGWKIGFHVSDRETSMTISPDLCIYIQGMKNPYS